jgi:hypothetical protein
MATLCFTLRNIKLAANTTSSTKPIIEQDMMHKYEESVPKLCNIIPNDKFLDQSGSTYPQHTHLFCWHCKNSFSSIPFGIPIQLYNRQNIIENDQLKLLYSNIISSSSSSSSSNTNSGISNVMNKICGTCSNMFQTRNPDIKNCVDCNPDNYIFIMHGYICSFECAMAYIEEYKHLEIYKNSAKLLNLLFYRCFNKLANITPAKDWRALTQYSGDLSMDIVTFRNMCKTHMISIPFTYLTPCGVYNQHF